VREKKTTCGSMNLRFQKGELPHTTLIEGREFSAETDRIEEDGK
jgi:hypothetical protein